MELKQLRPLVNSELWNLYTEVTKEKLESKYQELSNSTDSIQIYRLQGEIKTLKGILSLRDNINVA